MSIDYEKFIRSPYHTTINNVSSSVDSLLFKKINDRQDILEQVQIQDWKYSDPVYTNPRYGGAKTISSKYNFYTDGDSSYGKTAAADIITTKFGWANPTTFYSINFYDKTTINLKYLIDATGSLTELSKKNNNWFEVQNIYKKGDQVNISLLDKYNPSNQSGLDGDKKIYESGYSYSPIIFRELNETLKFLYDTPKETTGVRLGVKSVSTSSFVFQTIGNTDTNLTDTTNVWTYFKIDGIDKPGLPFSFNRLPTSQWPYASIPLETAGPYRARSGATFYNTQLRQYFSADNASLPGGGMYFYTMDWFIPNQSGSSYGGYATTDSAGAMKVNLSGGEWYSYFQAPRSSDYSVNLNIPIKVSFLRNPAAGPAIVKILGVIEKQEAGSANWTYVMSSVMQPTNIPESTYLNTIGVDASNSSLYLDGAPFGSNLNVEVNCVINNEKIGSLNLNDKVRLKVYFVEVRNFFRRCESVYVEISPGNTSKAFFEVYDDINSQISLDFDQDILGTTSTYAMFTALNDNTIEFDVTSSLLYNNSAFFAPTASNDFLIPNHYSSVESKFFFEPGDVVRFGTFFSINPELYFVETVIEPVIQTINNVDTVISPLRVVLDKRINPAKVNSRSFVFFKRKKDETTLIVEYKKPDGQSSNALIISYNLDKEIEKNTSNIINPIKDTILLKVLSG